jgi:prepilin-type processing-associated H-X9-DG protein
MKTRDIRHSRPFWNRERVLFWIVSASVIALLCLSLLPAFPPERRRVPRCRNFIRQIGLALHNYQDTYGCFPPAYIADEHGRPMHSWRVLILPYLDELPLYNEYRFDEPWNGPHNAKLADRFVRVFRCPQEPSDIENPTRTMTSYVAVIGPQTAWPGTQSVKLSDFADGRSNTILVAEVANSGIHWMEPRDLHVLQMNPAINPKAGQGISSAHDGGAHALLADGSVRFLKNDLPVTTVRALLTIRGGETIGEY